MQLQILISIIIIIIMIIIISRYPIINVAYVGATTVPIAFPIIWWKNSSLKIKSLVFKTRFKVLRIKDLLNLEWINSVYLSNQYSIAFNPNSCRILVFKMVTSNVTSFEFFVKFLSHFLRKSKSSFTKLLILNKRGLKRISAKSIRRLLRNLWHLTVWRSFKSFGWKHEM